MQLVTWYLFIAAHAVLAACLVALVHQQRSKEYPIFSGYMVCELVSFLIAFTLVHLFWHSLASRSTYLWTAVYASVITTAVEVAMLYELSDKLILSRSLLGATLRPLLRWSGAVLLLIAAAVSGFVAHPGMGRVFNVFETLNFASHLIVFGILFVLLVYSQALQVPWRSLSAGIALGLGISSSVEMSASALVSAFGAKTLIPADFISVTALLLCSSVWLVYILMPDRSVPRSGKRLGKSEVEFWENELQRMVDRRILGD